MHPTKKILVVDDEKALVQLCRLILEGEGYEVYTAYNGKQALLVVEEKLPDLVVLDVMMPGITGIDVCREIRGYTLAKQPFILMYTADERGSTVEESLSAGANAVLTKETSVYDIPKHVTAFLAKPL